ncbi:hypothetical protein EBR03_03665 [bacterium]|nr:hypothetical protein [bacterium]
MARAVKSKVGRGVKKAKVTKKPRTKLAPKTKPAVRTAKTKTIKPVQVMATPVVSAEESKKKISEKLLATIEKRKAEQAKNPAFSKPRGRRGRRPKNMVDYQPYSEEQQDDPYAYPSENENLEYDTGIRVSSPSSSGVFREDGGVSLDRVEDFDEELNFDW